MTSSLPNSTSLPSPCVAPFGAWRSPITPSAMVAESVSLEQPTIDGADIYWIEGRPREQGRSVVVRAGTSLHADLTPVGFSARNRVHEYGGAAFLVRDGTIWFCNDADQRIYVQTANQAPRAVTEIAPLRYADAILDAGRNRLICVREDHRDIDGVPCQRNEVNSIVAIDLASGMQQILAQGHDFFACPRLSPDGQTLTWLAWDHPNMPWDGTFLYAATVAADGQLEQARLIAGSNDDPIFQPTWSPDGELYFVSERSGWWNLYRQRMTVDAPSAAIAVAPMAAEFGRPLWNLGISTYGFTPNGELVCSFVEDGVWQIALCDPLTGQFERIVTPFRKISDLKVGDGFAVFVGGAPDHCDAIIRLDLRSRTWVVLQRAIALQVDPGYLSVPQAIRYPSGGGRTAHAFYYAPANRDFVGPDHAKPPLVVFNHGGPTSAASATLNLAIQFWTSRGCAVVDVNYGGSTGYGRDYRRLLRGQWGVVDVEDAIAAARFLVARGDADPDRLAIRGGSAGGYTALAALTFHDFFRAGASYYGVSDLEMLGRDCHKFESRYLDSMVGPYPEQRAVYIERSPIHFTQKLSVPLILFQGMQDKVVPPAQAAQMYAAVRAKGVPVAYLQFEDEAHGFRRAASIMRALEAELYFYGRIFGFTPADSLAPVTIENLPD
ncbi:MAG: S9 family peptidase [Pseudomonadota bacterium]|nr:S9 family peptidase [Pseudomonadota bacterium]